MILRNIDNFDKMKKAIKKAYRFLNVSKNKDGSILVDGLVGDNIQTVVVNNILLSYCQPIMGYITKSAPYYMLNGNIVSLYGLMDAFDKATPTNVTRYKGLGEMDPDQLRDSTLSPENRTLIRYTVQDIEKEEQQIRELENNKQLLLNELIK
jgi:DNA gyrase/topoisomerase IV subunit B